MGISFYPFIGIMLLCWSMAIVVMLPIQGYALENEQTKQDTMKVLDNLPSQQIDSDTPKASEQFFFVSNGLPLWEVVESVSKYYNKNIMVFDDVKDKKIYATIQGRNLKEVLDCLSWLIGVEYVEKDGIIFLGSNTQTVLVLPSSGVDRSIEEVFNNIKVKTVGDKILVVGSERDVARVKTAYAELVDRAYILVHLYAIEVKYDNDIQLGLDIDKSVKYAFSVDNILAGVNPVSSLILSLKASVVADESLSRISSVMDTDVGLVSGKEIMLQQGLDQDRPMYNDSTYGNRVITGYNTLHSGLILHLKGYFDQTKDWYIDMSLENSKALSDLDKELTIFNSTAKLNSTNPIQVMCRLNLGETTEKYTKGTPFLSDIPLIGYFFRVTQEKTYNKVIYIVLELKSTPISSVPEYDTKGIFELKEKLDAFKRTLNSI